MSFRAARLILCIGLVFSASLPSIALSEDSLRSPEPAGKNSEKISFSKQIAPILASYCTRCHGGERPRAGLSLEAFKDDASALKDPALWQMVVRNLHAKEMPPPNRPQPSAADVELITNWCKTAFPDDDCISKKDPGRVTLRRLNRAEYNNTIRDLVGVDFQPAEDFPADDVGSGFDNNGDVLTLPPLLMEKYLAAAEKVVDLAWNTPKARERVMICQPTEQTKQECARRILDSFGRRAYRRPLLPGEIDRLTYFVSLAETQGDSFEKGIQLGVQAVLVSPHFLFRVERDRRPTLNSPISDFELATRLSYFLWSSMPDDELFRLAQQGTLRKELENQIRRLLLDPKAKALVENFADQWLQLRNLKNAGPDPVLFPSFDESLRAAMLKETELFFEAVMKEDRSILEFVEADYTFVNERLAKHYRIPGIKGEQFQKVKLAGDQRGGILTHASILTITSNPTRTSPVKRGKWILETILGTPPPPPPPDAGELSEDKEVVLSGSLRQRMEQHRANPNCATCHQRMDPLGFGFENFDAIGAWREKDGKFLIDSSGVLPNGQSFQGPKELKAILKNKEAQFRRCLAEKMLTYALGRGVELFDKCAVDKIADGVAKNNNKFSSLVLEIVSSDPFQMRRGRRDAK